MFSAADFDPVTASETQWGEWTKWRRTQSQISLAIGLVVGVVLVGVLGLVSR